MKRSELNGILSKNIDFIKSMRFFLPPFAYWSADEFMAKNERYDEICYGMLGWDITDFGSGDFERIGLFLFTLRNGYLQGNTYSKPYAEKLLIVQEGQVTPYHYHAQKMEDIINRGGGNLLIRLYNKSPEDTFEDSQVLVSVNGCNEMKPAGSLVTLHPGDSITLHRYLYHSFWGEQGHGKIMVGEVSQVNDDHNDNFFFQPVGRFPDIVEDEEPLHLLSIDYPRYLRTKK
jgi:D-lyxose ketol-isomerase